MKQTLNIEIIQRQLDTQFFGIGDRLLYLPLVDSTNAVAMQLAQERSEEGVVVLTDSQTAGKGRLGRRWVDVSGCNVLSSTLLRPLFPPHLLIMVASLAVVDAIARTTGIAATIKWPNDVLIRDRKVAGILIETSHDRADRLIAILGIGVNVNGRIQDLPEPTLQQVPLLQTATALEVECGCAVSRETFIAHLLHSLESNYLTLQQACVEPSSAAFKHASRMIRERWRNQLSTLGRTIEVRRGDTVISGIAEGVNDNGELLLRRHSGQQVTITWGDVEYPAR